MRAKLRLYTREDGDVPLGDDLLGWMRRRSADFTNTFSALTRGRLLEESPGSDSELTAWHVRWAERRGRQPQPAAESDALMRRHNPAVIPRNHHVEAALSAATTDQDYAVMHRLLDALATPYDYERDRREYTAPGPADPGYRTFCGT
jgi:uncharacterized protein YdiU (UPF0061 family)